MLNSFQLALHYELYQLSNIHKLKLKLSKQWLKYSSHLCFIVKLLRKILAFDYLNFTKFLF